MAEKRRISRPANVFHYIIFGDGCIANLFDSQVLHGEDKIEFEFIPTPDLRYAHQIQEDEYDPNIGRIKKKYPRDMCVPLRSSPLGNRWLLLVDYNGKETDAVKLFNQDLLIRLQHYRKRAENAFISMKITQQESLNNEIFRADREQQLLEKQKRLNYEEEVPEGGAAQP